MNGQSAENGHSKYHDRLNGEASDPKTVSPTAASPAPMTTTAKTLRTHAQLQAHLSKLTQRESELTLALNQLISDRSGLDQALVKLRNLVPRVRKIEKEVDGVALDGRSPGYPATLGMTMTGGRNSGMGYGSDNGTIKGLIEEISPKTNQDYFDSVSISQESSNQGLVDRINRVYLTSERVGGKVRTLDRSLERIKSATDRVNIVLDIKTLFQTLEKSLDSNPPDYDLAARSYARLSSIPAQVLSSPFAGRVIPTAEYPSSPPEALMEWRTRLMDIFEREFLRKVQERDELGTGRFFRLFPEIDAEEEGLNIYGNFVVGLVKSRGAAGGKPSSPLYYISHLTSLLESIALIIDQHQPLISKYYGPARMFTVLNRLQSEADRVIRSLIEGWEEERRVGRLISETGTSKFSYLKNPIQQTGAALASLTLNAGVGTGLAALSSAQQGLANLPSAATSLLANYAGQKQRQEEMLSQQQQQALQAEREKERQKEEEEGPDVRDVDKVLGEMSALSGRWALYRRFVWSRLVAEDDEDDEEPVNGVMHRLAQQEGPGMDVLNDSDGQKAVDNMLRTYYEPLEGWYLRTSIEKAHKMDSPDLASTPYLSSVVDDVFYLLKISLNRIIATGSIRSLTSMRKALALVVERDYLGILQKKMDAVYSGGGAILNLPSLPGQNKEAERERREKEMRTSFSVLLNDLDISAGYMERLVEDTLLNGNIHQCFSDPDIPEVEKQLRSFTDVAQRMRTVAKSGLDQLFNQLTRPKLRALLEDCYKGISYVLDEDGYSQAESEDLVRKRFSKGWEPLVEGYKEAFTDGNFQLFFSLTVEVLVRPWEKMVFGMRFTELGAIRFDRDVRSIANYLSTQSNFGGARDKFIRLQQIATLLNLDADDDADDFYASSGIPWKLSKTEYNNVLQLRF